MWIENGILRILNKIKFIKRTHSLNFKNKKNEIIHTPKLKE